MRTLDQIAILASINRVFALASNVERWADFLPHYRWVRMLGRSQGGDVVEMAAWRDFGPLRYPTRWVSQMEVIPEAHVVRYRHIEGITRGMNVEWRIEQRDGSVHVRIEHLWDGPKWPLVGRLAANRVIGPVFIHHIASQTLAGVKREAERA